MIILTTFILLNCLLFNKPALANEVTVVNPVRGRELWIDRSIKHLDDQYGIARKNGIAASWLLQNDVLEDKELVEKIRNFDTKQEVGAFLEISKNLAERAGVVYPSQTYWYNPKAVFLSGYSRGERRKLIDRVYEDFENVFGYRPKSVGAWWIDSYSLNYIKNKYGLETVMIVADQKTTDGYGVWGQWAGVPYVADKHNLLLPSLNKKDGVTVIQWAQRDPKLGYLGEGPSFSNYSIQANDYLEQGKNINYFKEISKNYLDSGQLTIGLEVGQEAVGNLRELEKQIRYLKSAGAKFVTMSQFGSDFMTKWAGQETRVDGWKLTVGGRENLTLGQKINYRRGVAFSDYWTEDKNDFLERNLEKLDNKTKFYWPLWTMVMATMTIIAITKRWGWWGEGLIIILNGFGLLFRSKYALGWEVFYGSEVKNLMLIQMLVLLAGAMLTYKFKKIARWWLAGFGLIPLVSAINYSVIGGQNFLGIISGLKFFGVRLGEGVAVVGEKMPGAIIGSFLKFPWDRVWENPLLGLVVYPLTMLGVGMILSWLSNKINKKMAGVIWWGLMALMAVNLWQIINSDPRVVVGIK